MPLRKLLPTSSPWLVWCAACNKQTLHFHLHDTTDHDDLYSGHRHIPGTERFECSICGHGIRRGDAENLGDLVFLKD